MCTTVYVSQNSDSGASTKWLTNMAHAPFYTRRLSQTLRLSCILMGSEFGFVVAEAINAKGRVLRTTGMTS
jgi:hypothetical protein